MQQFAYDKCLENHDVGQRYATATDLSLTQKAYALVWNTPEFGNIVFKMACYIQSI